MGKYTYKPIGKPRNGKIVEFLSTRTGEGWIAYTYKIECMTKKGTPFQTMFWDYNPIKSTPLSIGTIVTDIQLRIVYDKSDTEIGIEAIRNPFPLEGATTEELLDEYQNTQVFDK